MTMLTLLVIWMYATRGNRLVSPNIDERIPPVLTKTILVGAIIVAASSIGELFITGVGYLLFLAAAWFIYMTAYGHKKLYISED